MRILPRLILVSMSLVVSLALTTTAEARLFWQTYGSTIPTANGCGCVWNWNQDYFVPRYPSSCRYEMYSPCKTSRSTSPACKWCHPLYPGYCSIYGPCHYRRRNHVYGARCGCSPILPRGNCCGAAPATGFCAADNGYGSVCGEPLAPLYNVEPSYLDVLGSIPVEGGDLLSRTDFSQLGNEGGQLLLRPQGAMPSLQGLPSLGLPPSGQLNLPSR